MDVDEQVANGAKVVVVVGVYDVLPCWCAWSTLGIVCTQQCFDDGVGVGVFDHHPKHKGYFVAQLAHLWVNFAL